MSFIIKSIVSQLPGLIEGSLQTIESIIGPQLTALKVQHADHAARFLENWRALNAFVEDKLQGISTSVKATTANYVPKFLHSDETPLMAAPADFSASIGSVANLDALQQRPASSRGSVPASLTSASVAALPDNLLPTASAPAPASSFFSSLGSLAKQGIAAATPLVKQGVASARQKLATARKPTGGKKRKGANKKRTRRLKTRK